MADGNGMREKFVQALSGLAKSMEKQHRIFEPHDPKVPTGDAYDIQLTFKKAGEGKARRVSLRLKHQEALKDQDGKVIGEDTFDLFVGRNAERFKLDVNGEPAPKVKEPLPLGVDPHSQAKQIAKAIDDESEE
jgi:hypothetical protein